MCPKNTPPLLPVGGPANTSVQVGGSVAVSQTVFSIMEFSRKTDVDASVSSSTYGDASGKKRRLGASKMIGIRGMNHGGLVRNTAEGGHASIKGDGCVGKVSGPASGLASRPALVTALVGEKESAPRDGGGVNSAPALERGLNKGRVVPALEPRGGGGEGQQSENYRHTRRRAFGDNNSLQTIEEKKRTMAARIGYILRKLPLSKMKIVIGAYMV